MTLRSGCACVSVSGVYWSMLCFRNMNPQGSFLQEWTYEGSVYY